MGLQVRSLKPPFSSLGFTVWSQRQFLVRSFNGISGKNSWFP
jgi:hypothetical protein